MIEWAKRPREDTPRMETRSFVDDAGVHWSGSVISGRFRGGEEHAEVVFICEDNPSETKRVATLERAPRVADEEWRAMSEDDVRDVFRRSEPA